MKTDVVIFHGGGRCLQLILLLGAAALLGYALTSGKIALLSGFPVVTFFWLLIGVMVGPFTGGNEAEWTRYLEKVLKSERDRLMRILNSLGEGIVIVGSDRVIRFMNPSMIRDFGDGVGSRCHTHLRGLQEPCPGCRLSHILIGETERWEYRLADGRTFEVISSPFAEPDQTPCMLAAFRNVTQERQLEMELIELNQLKSDLLLEKTKELEQISKDIARLKEQRQRLIHFLGATTHDLRAPLGAIQSCLWTILDGYAGPITDEQRDLLLRSTRRIDGLLSLIADLLDIPRIEAGQLVKEMNEISFNEVVEHAVDSIRELAKNKQLKLEVELPVVSPSIYGSSRRLQQVLINILSNAINYTPEGSIVVRVIDTENELRVEVIDTGVGIPADELPKLFQDFVRGTNVKSDGTGLGLSISRRIIEAHGGRIWAESPSPEMGKGSKFTFTLPKRIRKEVATSTPDLASGKVGETRV